MLSLLLSIGFLGLHLPAALLLGPMLAGIIFSMRGVTLQLPRSAFSRRAGHSWLHDCAKPDRFDPDHASGELADCVSYFTGDVTFQRHRGLVIGAL